MEPGGSSDRGVALRSIRRRYYSLWLVYSFAGGFLFGVYPLFLRARGLDQFQINSVLAAYFVVIFLTDVPTGAFADAMGRRNSMLLGCALRVAGFLSYFFAHHYLVFFAAELFDGVGTTFCNGAIDAWGVDALDAAGFEGIRDRLFSRISQLMHVGFMASALIGAYVADYNIAWPWLLGAAGYLVSAAIGAWLMSGADKGRGPSAGVVRPARIAGQVARRVADGIRQGFQLRTVVLLSLANGILFAAWAPYWMEWPQLINDSYGVGMWIIGWVFCLFTLGHVVGAELITRVANPYANRGKRLALLAVAAAVMFFGAGMCVARPNLAVGFLVGFRACTGAMQPLMNAWLNEQIQTGERATLLSFSSTFSTLGGSGGLLITGAVADSFGIALTWQILAVIALTAAACFWALRFEPIADGQVGCAAG
jgi:MFS family permease